MVNTVLLADGVYFAANWSRLYGFALTDAEGVTAERLTGTVAGLRSAVEAAVALDRSESFNIWEELKSLWGHGLVGYWKDRQDFEKRGEAHIEAFLDLLVNVETAVSSVQEVAGPVPAKLESDAQAWKDSAAKVADIRDRIATIRNIPGWQGASSGGYTNRNIVQDSATTELGGVAGSLATAIKQIALINRALFLYMDREIKTMTALIKGLNGSGDGSFYRRSFNGKTMLQDLLNRLTDAQVGAPVRDVAQGLKSTVEQCLSSPQLLAPGAWPTGGGQVGTPPSNTDSVPDPDFTDRVDDPATHRTPTDGGEQRNP